MAIKWNHALYFVLLNLGRLSPLTGRVRSRLLASMALLASLKTSWHEPYEGEAIGYEAGWAGVFQNQGIGQPWKPAGTRRLPGGRRAPR